jgi:predicted Zn-dependent protease
MSVPTSEKVADPERPDTLFIQAQREYLGGHWEEAETLLRRRIENTPRDVEARLLLVTMLRHTRRLDLARNQLHEMMRFDEALEWEFEVDREQQLIELIQRHEAAEQLTHTQEQDSVDFQPTNNDGIIRVPAGDSIESEETNRQSA